MVDVTIKVSSEMAEIINNRYRDTLKQWFNADPPRLKRSRKNSIPLEVSNASSEEYNARIIMKEIKRSFRERKKG
jgi:hypothetical protein